MIASLHSLNSSSAVESPSPAFGSGFFIFAVLYMAYSLVFFARFHEST